MIKYQHYGSKNLKFWKDLTRLRGFNDSQGGLIQASLIQGLTRIYLKEAKHRL